MSVMPMTYDVFLSHSIRDSQVADAVAQRFEAAGLNVFTIWNRPASGKDVIEVIWEALAESAAIVAVVTPTTSDFSSLGVEVGAARAWQKPTYVLVEGNIASSALPTYLQSLPNFPMVRLPDVVKEVERISEPLTDDQRNLLRDVYVDLNASVDDILTQPALRNRLAKLFSSAARRHLPADRLMRELLRLRKGGELPSRRNTA